IDDIQFLAGKEQTQEEFFHTFNALHDDDKQIVITSDRTPKEIPNLEDRLRSRFGWRLTTDITPPDLETRIAILKKKCEEENVVIPKESMMYIANHIDTNIRELEGALTRVAAYANLTNQTMSPEVVAEALKDIVKEPKQKKITIEDIQQVVAEYYGIKIEDFASKNVHDQLLFLDMLLCIYQENLQIILCRKLEKYLAVEIIQQLFTLMKKSQNYTKKTTNLK